MTDKERIIAEIERLKFCTMDEHMKFYCKEAEIEYNTLCRVVNLIKSMQEELVSSIWHDASEKSNEAEDVVVINPSDNTGEVLTRCINVYQGRIWAYTSVLLNLDNPCKIGKNLQEYPVSEDLEGAAITAADEDMQGRQIMEESNEKRQLYSRIFRRGFKAGANWQKALELTWDDIHAIAIIEDKLIHELCLNDQTLPHTQEFYEEVLKRFKTKKEESC